jgi:hypothetical protein
MLCRFDTLSEMRKPLEKQFLGISPISKTGIRDNYFATVDTFAPWNR